MAQSDEEKSALVRSLFDVAPGEDFTLRRYDGTEWKEIPIRVEVLSVEQNHEVLIAAQRYAKERGEVSTDYGDIYKEAQAVELLVRCLKHPDKKVTRQDGTEYYRRMFVDAKQVRTSMTEREMALCVNYYEIVRAKFGPIESFGTANWEIWAARLSDPLLGEYFLGRSDSSQWPELAITMAQEVRALREELGRPLPSWQDSLESDPSSSEPATGSSSTPPSAQSSEGAALPIPSDRLLNTQEARELGDQIHKPKRRRKKK